MQWNQKLVCKFTLNNLVRLFKEKLYRHLVIKLQVERVLITDQHNGIKLLCKFTLNNLVWLFKKMLYRHLVIKLQVERVLQIDAMESETCL